MNGASQKGILVAICVIAATTVAGSSLKPESTVQIIGFGSMICVSLLALLHQMKSAERTIAKLDKAANKVDEVKQTLAAATSAATSADVASKVEVAGTLEDIARVGNANHTLLNNNMGVQLLKTATALRELADERYGDEKARRAAEEAERLYQDHMAKQHMVDQVKDRQDKKDSG